MSICININNLQEEIDFKYTRQYDNEKEKETSYTSSPEKQFRVLNSMIERAILSEKDSKQLVVIRKIMDLSSSCFSDSVSIYRQARNVIAALQGLNEGYAPSLFFPAGSQTHTVNFLIKTDPEKKLRKKITLYNTGYGCQYGEKNGITYASMPTFVFEDDEPLKKAIEQIFDLEKEEELPKYNEDVEKIITNAGGAKDSSETEYLHKIQDRDNCSWLATWTCFKDIVTPTIKVTAPEEILDVLPEDVAKILQNKEIFYSRYVKIIDYEYLRYKAGTIDNTTLNELSNNESLKRIIEESYVVRLEKKLKYESTSII